MTTYRVIHDWEYQGIWRSGVPEVFHFDQVGSVWLTREWQELIYALNPGMTGKGFRSLLGNKTAFCNGTGFDGGVPRADFINMRDLKAKLPRLDKARLCGGAIINGTLAITIATIRALNGNVKPPSLQYVLDHPEFYFECVTVRADGSNGRFPQNSGRPVYMPLVSSVTLTIHTKPIQYSKPYPCIKSTS